MNTNNMSDEELDRLFRKAAQDQDPPFEEEAWLALEQKLDEVQVPRPWFRRLLPFLLLVAVSLLVVLKQSSDQIDVIANKEDAAAVERAPAPTTVASTLTGASPRDSRAKGLAKATNSTGTADTAPTTVAPVTVATKREAAPGGVVTAREKATAPPFAQALPARAGQEQVLAQAPPATQSLLETKVAAMPTTEGVITRGTVLSVPLLQATAPPQQEDMGTAEDSSLQKKQAFAQNVRLAVAVAPDITAVKFKSADAVSANVGLLVGLPLANRLSLVTGVVWADKVYGAAPEDYAPTPDYWVGKTLPNSIEARCEVLDIPLNLEYNLWQRDRNSLAVQAGLSSYIMLNEEYTYTYGRGYATYEKTWAVKNQNRHWFKVQNISVSYYRQLTPALQVGVEPFVKIPLGDIGAGHVRLTSAGLFFKAACTLPFLK